MSNLDMRISTQDAEAVITPLTPAEIMRLRRLLSVASYDEHQRGFVIDTGRARLVLRDDGTIRCEGKSITVAADGVITMDGAAIELN